MIEMGKVIVGTRELPFGLQICYHTVCLRQKKRINMFIVRDCCSFKLYRYERSYIIQ